MPATAKFYSGRVIGALGLTLIYWALPLVMFSLLANMNPDNAETQRLAQRWVGKNQPFVIGLLSILSLIALLWDWRKVKRGTATMKSALRFGFVMAAVQWFNVFSFGDHKEFWVVSTAYFTVVFLTLVIGTRLIAMEVEHLEGNAGTP